MGTLWRSCAKVRKPMELPFGVVRGVGPVIIVLDGVHISKGKGRFGGFDVYWLVWDLPLRPRQRNVLGSCEKIW